MMKPMTAKWLVLPAALACAAVFCAISITNAAETKREVLSKHQTVAQFEKVAYQRCLGMTALCPDKCGGSGDFASFRILKYLAYEKPGEYGDPKQTEYIFQVEDNMKNLKITKAMKDIVTALKPGDYLLLDWQHDYVTADGTSSPDRVLKKLQKITREEADKLTGGLDKLPPPPAPRTTPGARGAGPTPRAF
jgi:hypothetical protein